MEPTAPRPADQRRRSAAPRWPAPAPTSRHPRPATAAPDAAGSGYPACRPADATVRLAWAPTDLRRRVQHQRCPEAGMRQRAQTFARQRAEQQRAGGEEGDATNHLQQQAEQEAGAQLQRRRLNQRISRPLPAIPPALCQGSTNSTARLTKTRPTSITSGGPRINRRPRWPASRTAINMPATNARPISEQTIRPRQRVEHPGLAQPAALHLREEYRATEQLHGKAVNRKLRACRRRPGANRVASPPAPEAMLCPRRRHSGAIG